MGRRLPANPHRTCKSDSAQKIDLSRLELVIRHVFVVHSAYIVGTLLLFVAITPGFASYPESGKGWGDSCAPRRVCSGCAWCRSDFSIEFVRECCVGGRGLVSSGELRRVAVFGRGWCLAAE